MIVGLLVLHTSMGIGTGHADVLDDLAGGGPVAGGSRFLDPTNGLLIVGLGTTAYLSRAHVDGQRIVAMFEESPLEWGIDLADLYGEGSTLGLAALGLMAYGRAMGSETASEAGHELVASLLTAWTLTWTLKASVNARRPDGGPYSFPSGHTATAFAAAPVLHRQFGGLVGWSAYTVAALTGLARLEEHKHYLADVLVGAAIGIVSGRTLFRVMEWTVPPYGPGVGLSVRF